MTTKSTFEMLPDEIILHICSYLRGSDVLYSFFDLNVRFNQAIEGYCRYINLLAPAYKPFHHVISHVLPRIGSLVQSFVLNGNWEGVLSQNALDIIYGSQLSVLFPQLQKLTLKWFTCQQMSLFLDSLNNFSQLVRLDIISLNESTEDDLLTKLLAANNNRLRFVSFDKYSIGLNVPEDDEVVSYPNIEELSVNINVNQSFPRLFTLVPNVRRLHVILSGGSDLFESNISYVNLSPLVHLTDFQLRSIIHSWTLDEIIDMLHLIPSLQSLTLDLRTADERLANGENLRTVLPSSLRDVHVCIRYYFSESSFDKEALVASWPDRVPMMCLSDETRQRVLLFTIPYNLCSLILPADIDGQMTSGDKYLDKVDDLYIYNAWSLSQILVLLQHFHRLRSLAIKTKDKAEALAVTPLPQPILIKLPHLEKLTVYGICPVLPFVKTAYKLQHLIVTFDCLKKLLDDDETCQLLQQRITRLDIDDLPSTESHFLKRVAEVFTSLHQLIIGLTHSSHVMDSIILEILSHWYNQRIHWLFINGTLSDQAASNPRQWLLENARPFIDNSFSVDYQDKWLTLWK